MYFTHSLVGAVAQRFVIDKVDKKFTEKEKRVLWIVGITASVLPDFDLIYSALNHMANHRGFITHGLFIYLLMSLFLYLLSFTKDKKEFGQKFFKTLVLCFLIGISVHFLMDFMVGGIVFLAPFSYKVYGLEMSFERYNGNWLFRYLESRYMFLELFNLSYFLIVLKNKKYFFGKIVAFGYLLMAIFAFVFINMIFFT
ncbi:metal-dependent hydrolase [Patescibacteria group bacterium]|nr:metal-dependent hydrolase [Patescibacteria group bacterium]MBU1952888.1 metal-dependent hydrolase [Patescibacteria group bacterium]